jgi:transcriptional/translational regulatory protein YebC/TACO1
MKFNVEFALNTSLGATQEHGSTSYWHHQKSLVHTQSEEQRKAAEICATTLHAEREREEQQDKFAQLQNISTVKSNFTMQDHCRSHKQEMWHYHEMNFDSDGFNAGDDLDDLVEQG